MIEPLKLRRPPLQLHQLPAILLVIFIAMIYIPLILEGGIVLDDWGDIAQNLSCNGFWNCYGNWFPLFSNRPLAPLPITVSTLLFKTNVMGYLIMNTLFYLLSIYLTSKVLLNVIGKSAAYVFGCLACIPFIAMPVIVSPINQSTATLSFLFWSSSLFLIFSYSQRGRPWKYWLSTVLLLCAFLTYEIILPLLVLNAFLPALFYATNKKWGRLAYAIRYILPIVVVLAITVLWQKGLAPQLMEVDSRLKFNSGEALAKIYTWAHVFFVQIPSLFFKSLTHFSTLTLISSTILGACLFFAFPRTQKLIQNKQQIQFLILSFATFLSSSTIFMLANESANSWGYQARGLSSTWLALAILIAAISALITSRKSPILWIIIIFGGFSSACFSIQRDNYIASWKLQTLILGDALSLIKAEKVPQDAALIGNVPKFLKPNFNDELVFSQPWDFPAALAILSNNNIRSGAVLDSRRGDFRKIQFINNQVRLENWSGANADNLWFYDFDPINRKGTLRKMHSLLELESQIAALGYRP